MNRRWWDRIRGWPYIWRWCPECERNGIERAEAVNQVIYWRGLYDDVSVVSYARGILVERLLKHAAHAGALTREECECMATEIESCESGPPKAVREAAASELRRLIGWAPPAEVPETWECRSCGGTTRCVHEDQSVSCDDCGRFEHETRHPPTAEGE